ncbi:MAG: hypothetical protein H0U21_02930 [Acidimicrobiia bacterium]|nr:hypothetical protein [Acidimicrobiia bacterium]
MEQQLRAFGDEQFFVVSELRFPPGASSAEQIEMVHRQGPGGDGRRGGGEVDAAASAAQIAFGGAGVGVGLAGETVAGARGAVAGPYLAVFPRREHRPGRHRQAGALALQGDSEFVQFAVGHRAGVEGGEVADEIVELVHDRRHASSVSNVRSSDQPRFETFFAPLGPAITGARRSGRRRTPPADRTDARRSVHGAAS